MKSRLETFLAGLAVAGLLILLVIVLLLVAVPGRIASGKQVTMDRARASLSAALDDLQSAGLPAGSAPKRYGYNDVYPCTLTATVGGTNYQFVLVTGGDYDQNRLAVTTNREFIWLDNRRGPKLIPPDYKVSKWRSGY